MKQGNGDKNYRLLRKARPVELYRNWNSGAFCIREKSSWKFHKEAIKWHKSRQRISSHSAHNFSHQQQHEAREKLEFLTVDNNRTGNYNPSAFRFGIFACGKIVFAKKRGESGKDERRSLLCFPCEFQPFIFKGCSCQIQIIVTCKFAHISLSHSYWNSWRYVMLFCS